MTPKEAADYIGCSPQQVRTLIRRGKIKARKHKIPGGRKPGYCYLISKKEAERYRDAPQRQGWPRGQHYKIITKPGGKRCKKMICRRLVRLPDGRQTLEIEEIIRGGSETHACYSYPKIRGVSIYETDYWGRIKGVEVLEDI